MTPEQDKELHERERLAVRLRLQTNIIGQVLLAILKLLTSWRVLVPLATLLLSLAVLGLSGQVATLAHQQVDIVDKQRAFNDSVLDYSSTTKAALAMKQTQINLLAAQVDELRAPAGAQVFTVTMYTSRPEETDDTPCIAASGKDICKLASIGEQVCAQNDVPFGTILRIYGMGVCTVWDRMASDATGQGKIDWYLGQGDDKVAAAKKFGVGHFPVQAALPQK